MWTLQEGILRELSSMRSSTQGLGTINLWSKPKKATAGSIKTKIMVRCLCVIITER